MVVMIDFLRWVVGFDDSTIRVTDSMKLRDTSGRFA
jgi:hypothetical protein